ncbi:transcriptional regulator [Dokdonia pacifica]|uniref:Transcriptional regulator, AsnC family n=1 Tax=Dokdonia pacifica TaxID=1627892 RepID=A0A239AUC7_9FLAO|nr:Lrp/AsnC family transcriptional regulator [Dokdonia pacifica]GGG31708.1 transcriptional regulator [Dokdonia pacifica]SNR98951.1 transcriptional regulator, AsnC family [Dokdonia pacifica]
MIDSIDNKLLAILKDNSRLSFADLGRKINLSPSAVRERVQKMEDNEVIEKYSIQINQRKLGYDIEAFILLKVFQGQLKHVIQQVATLPEVVEAHRITGSQNIHLKVLLKSQLDLQKLIDKLMNFGDTNTFLILSKI